MNIVFTEDGKILQTMNCDFAFIVTLTEDIPSLHMEGDMGVIGEATTLGLMNVFHIITTKAPEALIKLIGEGQAPVRPSAKEYERALSTLSQDEIKEAVINFAKSKKDGGQA